MTASLRSALSHHLTLDRAHTAAHAGDLDLAARLLDELDAAGAATPTSLDLRARVHAQRGELAEADRCWARVLLLVPDDEGATAGRDTIARVRAGHRARPLVHAGAATAAVAVVLGVALVGGAVWATSGDGPSAPPVAAAPAPAGDQGAEVRRLEQELAAATGARQQAVDQRSRDLDAIAAAFAMPGVLVERRTEDVRLVFEEGVFRSDAELAPGSWPLLAEVGRRLAGTRAATTVVGHVVAVAGGPTSGGSTVAWWRAQVAAEVLAEGGGLPLTAFTLTTADQSDGPFADAPRNRTVTVVLRPTG
ncbi:tetratricopeptide repeat protein [Saccharothrix stipae]